MPRSRSSKKPSPVTPEQAAAILKQVEQDKIDACGDAIEIVLRKHDCIMEPQIIIRGTRIYAQMIIIANPAPNQQTQMQRITSLQPIVEEEKEAETPEEKKE